MSEVQIIQYGSADQWPQEVLVYTDGASRGNPGPASVGIHVCDFSENTIFEYGETLGEQTNNFAEYSAVKIALEMACEQKVEKIKIRSDSELLVKQMKGEYKVKSEMIKPLFLICKNLISKIGQVEFEHVRREKNKRADQLANMVLDGEGSFPLI